MYHNERCKECKVRVRQLLEKIYGTVIPNHRIDLETRPEEMLNHPHYTVINKIYTALQNHRGFSDFVRASYVDVDFFLPGQNMIVEFDESQHFTEPRKITLSQYPVNLSLGFSLETWMKHCDEILAHDNDPPYRDEQRAWYDTLRDFIPEQTGFNPTKRLFSKDCVWCSLNPDNVQDVERFLNYIEKKKLDYPEVKYSGINGNQNKNQSILDLLIEFEFFTNKLKMQYLNDCFTKSYNYQCLYLQEEGVQQKILNSGGDAFKVYFDFSFRGKKGRRGPLFLNATPKDSEIVRRLSTCNTELKEEISSNEEWFSLFCEYTLIKTSIHEIIADIPDEENVNKYGYNDLACLRDIANDDEVSGAVLRNFVVHCLNLGINPSENREGIESNIESFADLKYAAFQARRKEWSMAAWYFINCIKRRMTVENLSSVMRWDRYSLCNYDTGPIFIRKNREFILPHISRSFELYSDWEQNNLRKILHEIIEKEVYLIVDNYWDYFENNQCIMNFGTDLKFELSEKLKIEERKLEECFKEVHPENQIQTGITPKLRSSSNSKRDTSKQSYFKKFRPLFNNVIESYNPLIPPNFKKRATSSTKNCILVADDLPEGIHYEFTDWGSEIAIELIFDKSKLSNFETYVREFSLKEYPNLPVAKLTPQKITSKKEFFRLQFFYVDNIESNRHSALNFS